MIKIIKEIKTEITKPNVFQALVAKQYDMNTRFIKATFVDDGNVICIPSGPTIKVVINAERPDGLSKGFEGEVNEDGTVTVPLHSWMLELDGKVICDISVIDTAADDNKKLTTTTFNLLVEKAAFGGDDITLDPQFDVLVALLEASETAQEALEKSNEANSKYDACVEATEVANNTLNELEDIKADLANGGYITSFKEINHGNYLSFWVGTQAEYDALTEKPTNCYVIITDDTTIADIEQRIEETKAEHDNDIKGLNKTIEKNGALLRSSLLFDDVHAHGDLIRNISDYGMLSARAVMTVENTDGSTRVVTVWMTLYRCDEGSTAKFEGSFAEYTSNDSYRLNIIGNVFIKAKGDSITAASGTAYARTLTGEKGFNVDVYGLEYITGIVLWE